MMSASLPQSNAADPNDPISPPTHTLALVPEYKPIDDIDLPKPPTCCLCFTPIGYSIGKQTSAGPILCEKCSKRLKRRAEMKRKLETLIANCEQRMPGRQKREKVDCLHCGHGFLTKESLWDHMVSARQRLASQCDSNGTSEWMYAIASLLEMQCTDKNPLLSDALEESIIPAGKRRSTGQRECSYSDVIPDYHPSEVESGLDEEDWYLIASEEWGQSSSRDHTDLLDRCTE